VLARRTERDLRPTRDDRPLVGAQGIHWCQLRAKAVVALWTSATTAKGSKPHSLSPSTLKWIKKLNFPKVIESSLEDFSYETGVFNPWRIVLLTVNLTLIQSIAPLLDMGCS
jgi:hypothetical protein